MYFIKFMDESLEEAIQSHGGPTSGYETKEKALKDAIETGDNAPFVILDKNLKVVHKEPDYEG